MKDIELLFQNIRTHSENGKPFLHKPLLIVFALGQCYLEKRRMISFHEIDKRLTNIFHKFYPEGLEKNNTHYPFGRLENDKMWEVENSQYLSRTSVGHLLKKELIEKNIHGGFTEEIYQTLIQDKALIMNITKQLLNKFFPKKQHDDIKESVGLPQDEIQYCKENRQIIQLLNQDSDNKKPMHPNKNGFITYLNSLHNLEASGANALAESQALNHYFAELYQAFPVVDDIFKALTSEKEAVVVISGHAGDGKSTIGLDIFKHLRKIPLDQPLHKPLAEFEEVEWTTPQGSRPVFLVKDMSELTAQTRLNYIQHSFDSPGSWLIISNTGPLLNSLQKYADDRHAGDVESAILERLDQVYTQGNLAPNTLDQFPKPLVIINMARINNTTIGAQLLTRIVHHSAWQHCTGCTAEAACPLLLNRRALLETGTTAEDRVRWIYQRLNAYEQRLTMRQMVAHLALSLTGGMSCEHAQAQLMAPTDQGALENGSKALGKVVFSEGFFGYREGKPWPEAENLRAIALIRRSIFGGPIAVDFERQLTADQDLNWIRLPDSLSALHTRWRSHTRDHAGVRWRFAQRRLLYIFGIGTDHHQARINLFLDQVLQSPRLRDFDQWQRQGGFGAFDPIQQRKFCRICLRVLLEIFSGFSTGQFQTEQDQLYLTLRRPDQAVAQPTQLVIAALSFDEFDLHYDSRTRQPMLRFQSGKIDLPLSLPLLDYIQSRHAGELGNELARIHLAQLEWFRAELLRLTQNRNSSNIRLLQSGVDGRVYLHRYLLDEKNQQLEIG